VIAVPKAAIDLAKRFEGFERRVKRGIEVAAISYICPASFWMIGYGHLCDPKRPPITEAEAEVYLARDLQSALAATLRYCPVLATEPEGATGCHCGLHLQPRCGAVADVDVTATGYPARLVCGQSGVEPLGLCWRKNAQHSDQRRSRLL
jgi:hypothetical protein